MDLCILSDIYKEKTQPYSTYIVPYVCWKQASHLNRLTGYTCEDFLWIFVHTVRLLTVSMSL